MNPTQSRKVHTKVRLRCLVLLDTLDSMLTNVLVLRLRRLCHRQLVRQRLWRAGVLVIADNEDLFLRFCKGQRALRDLACG